MKFFTLQSFLKMIVLQETIHQLPNLIAPLSVDFNETCSKKEGQDI
jgi:hypothetical protein